MIQIHPLSSLTRKALNLTGALAMLASSSLIAAPVIVDLTGTITDANGVAAPFLSTGINGHLVFDLDAGNALDQITYTENGITTTRWTFSGYGSHSVSPYNQTQYSGAFGLFSNPDFVEVETLDNVDLDALGNPFGQSGVVDVMSVWAIIDTADCSIGGIDPDTGGCADPNTPILEGDHFGVHFIGASDWFSGNNVLPAFLPDMNNLLAVFGEADNYASGNEVGYAEVTYSSFTASGDTGSSTSTSVPAPAPALLLFGGSALLWRVRRKS